MTKFHECLDMYEVSKRNGQTLLDWRVFYDKERDWVIETKQPRRKLLRVAIEHDWRDGSRPFYMLYPEAMNMLRNTSLALDPGRLPQMAVPVVCVTFAIDSLTIGRLQVTNVFVGHHSDSGLMVHARYKATDTGEFESLTMSMVAGKTIDDQLSHISTEGDENIAAIAVTRIAAGITILASQPEMIERVLLAKDVLKGRSGPDAERRAMQRGVNGWSIGKNLEGFSRDVSGHIRRPHFAIRWTEKGRKTPKLVPVKGSIVHRSKLTTIPTGYLDKPDPSAEQGA